MPDDSTRDPRGERAPGEAIEFASYPVIAEWSQRGACPRFIMRAIAAESPGSRAIVCCGLADRLSRPLLYLHLWQWPLSNTSLTVPLIPRLMDGARAEATEVPWGIDTCHRKPRTRNAGAPIDLSWPLSATRNAKRGRLAPCGQAGQLRPSRSNFDRSSLVEAVRFKIIIDLRVGHRAVARLQPIQMATRARCPASQPVESNRE